MLVNIQVRFSVLYTAVQYLALHSLIPSSVGPLLPLALSTSCDTGPVEPGLELSAAQIPDFQVAVDYRSCTLGDTSPCDNTELVYPDLAYQIIQHVQTMVPQLENLVGSDLVSLFLFLRVIPQPFSAIKLSDGAECFLIFSFL